MVTGVTLRSTMSRSPTRHVPPGANGPTGADVQAHAAEVFVCGAEIVF